MGSADLYRLCGTGKFDMAADLKNLTRGINEPPILESDEFSEPAY